MCPSPPSPAGAPRLIPCARCGQPVLEDCGAYRYDVRGRRLFFTCAAHDFLGQPFVLVDRWTRRFVLREPDAIRLQNHCMQRGWMSGMRPGPGPGHLYVTVRRADGWPREREDQGHQAQWNPAKWRPGK